ncbi:hypothetical protein ASPTUDRAFT_47584 [Aspergillus tubingensis CBS 134.48]|uniref:Uncharacterized protein n=1 Tax=Aspergillus tubingensis (strain CBS 134.48) TaxID=767770 RepID=A0A1L9MTZ5_ASPTC|nr:hypothetical protein ASPTUDRAFT_47584 [Aspergillus tubingensis CBS 134.48]
MALNPSGALIQCPSPSAPTYSNHSTSIPARFIIPTTCLPNSTETIGSSVPWPKSTGVFRNIISSPAETPTTSEQNSTNRLPRSKSPSSNLSANGIHPQKPKTPPNLPCTLLLAQNQLHSAVAMP